MSTHDPRPEPHRPAVAAADEYVPEERAPSEAENTFMSVALFAFLILFGISCFILF
jgi:hypothetical protein